jgi:large subunit ribosomal protein L18
MKTQRRRKNEKRTDYKKRFGYLKSGKPRIVIRKTNNYLIVQLIESFEAKDKIIAGMNSKELLKHGWPENLSKSLKSISASYLTGYLFGKKIKGKEVIVDLGLVRNVHGSRIYALQKGLVDAGVKIKVDEKTFPSKDRIEGKHQKKEIQEAFKKVKESIK